MIEKSLDIIYNMEDNKMLNTLMMLASAPQTGDTFPKGVLIGIIIAALLLAVGTAVFAKKKGENDDDDDGDDE